MPAEPELSIVVPVYNVEPFLPACLDSLVGQMPFSHEIILVDDGSTDACGTICDEYALAHDVVHAIHQKNSGLSEARNTGLQHAKGMWVMFVDSDDWLQPQTGQVLAPLLAGAYDLVYYAFQEVYGDGRVKQHPITSETAPHTCSPQELAKLQETNINRFSPNGNRGKNITSACQKIVRRQYLLEHDIWFKGRFLEDILYTAKLLHNGPRVLMLPDILYNYRVQQGSLVHAYKPWVAQELERHLEDLYRFMDEPAYQNQRIQDALNARAIIAFSYLVVLDLCHPDNTKPYRQRKQEFGRYRSQSIYRRGFCNMRCTKGMPLQRRVLARLSKLKGFWAIDRLNRLRS